MKKKIAGILLIGAVLTVATGLVFADTASRKIEKKISAPTEVNFTAQLHFNSSADNHVELELSNYGNRDMLVSAQAHYIDEIGSAGSWDCRAAQNTGIAPQQTESVDFEITDTAAHGDNSILAFFFKYDGQWYLGKVGKNNGVEYYLQHN